MILRADAILFPDDDPDRPRSVIPPPRSPLSRAAARAFGLDAPVDPDSGVAAGLAPRVGHRSVHDARGKPRGYPEVTHPTLPASGRVVLFAGPSGGGKSTRLRHLAAAARRAGWRVHDVARRRLRTGLPAIDQFGRGGDGEADLDYAAGHLSRVGLGEAAAMLRLPGELSDGQRWRLRLAVTVHRVMREARHGRPTLLVADEFCAVLDRVSACVVARGLRRTIDRLARVGVPVRAAVATSHDDLSAALLPDETVWCET